MNTSVITDRFLGLNLLYFSINLVIVLSVYLFYTPPSLPQSNAQAYFLPEITLNDSTQPHPH